MNCEKCEKESTHKLCAECFNEAIHELDDLKCHNCDNPCAPCYDFDDDSTRLDNDLNETI